MKLFNFVKKQQEVELTPEQTIRHLVEHIPDLHKTHKQFINCIEYLDHREWGLALDSLIELANETEPFRGIFWFRLADAAYKMGLLEEANYCKEQIKRNE